MQHLDIYEIEEKLKNDEEVSSLTVGISMEPMLRQHRDIVIIKRVNGRLKRNDVPLYRRAGCDRFILHRILKVTNDGYVIRGDNLYRKEYDVKDGDIIGVLKAFYRDGKYYDCEKSRKYKTYVFFMRASYPFRYFWKFRLRPFLGKIKRFILVQKNRKK